jgi:tetratricopeptide (TPR) repeat protein
MRRRVPAVMASVFLAGASSLPARADAQSALADFKAGRYLEAAAEIQAVVDRSPGYAYGYFLLGHCMLKMRHTTNAEFQFRRALFFDSTRAEFFQGLALALNASGNWPMTVRATSEGLTRSPDPRTRFDLLALQGYAWGALHRWDNAVVDLEAAQRLYPEPWLLVLLGKARFAAGRWSDAVPPLRRVLQNDPDDPVVLKILAECFLRMAGEDANPVQKRFNYTQSLAYAQRLTSVTPDDLEAVNLVGRAALGAGKLDQAENVFRHVLVINPRQCYALANLGRTYMASARWPEAEASLRQASACAPRLATVYESLGELYLQVGRPDEAAVAFRRAEEIEPTQGLTAAPEAQRVFSPR